MNITKMETTVFVHPRSQVDVQRERIVYVSVGISVNKFCYSNADT